MIDDPVVRPTGPLVHVVSPSLSRLEADGAAGSDLNRSASLWVAALTSSTLAGAPSTEACDRDNAIFRNAVLNAPEDGVDGFFSACLGSFQVGADEIDEFALVHADVWLWGEMWGSGERNRAPEHYAQGPWIQFNWIIQSSHSASTSAGA